MMDLPVKEAVLKRVKRKYDGYVDQNFGIVIDVANVMDIQDGVIIPGDGAPYYPTEFELLIYKPEMQEVIHGKIKDIADFGAFITMGPMEGMIHVSQTMDDFVSFSKEKQLLGKETKRMLKVGDKCRARIIAISYKDISSPKFGLTMRQKGLGKLEWLEEEGSEPAEKETKKKK